MAYFDHMSQCVVPPQKEDAVEDDNDMWGTEDNNSTQTWEENNSPCVHSGTTTSRTVPNDTGPIHANAASATIDLTAAPPWMTQGMLQQFMAHLKALPQPPPNSMAVGNYIACLRNVFPSNVDTNYKYRMYHIT